MSQTKYPQLWDESGKPVGWDSLKEGYLVKVSMDYSTSDRDDFGFFRGTDDCPEGIAGIHRLFLEVPENIAPNTVPGYCNGKCVVCDFSRIQLVEIVSREAHAARLIFDSIGRLKLHRNTLRGTVTAASRALTGAD